MRVPTESDSVEDMRLRRKAKMHVGLAAGFTLCAGGFALAYLPPLLAGDVSFGAAAMAAITVFGFASLIFHEVRAAIRAKRELNHEARGLSET